MSSFYRGHPKVKKIDMLHVNDYPKMEIDELNKKILDSKNLDKQISKSIEYSTL